MIRLCTYVIVAMGAFSASEAISQAAGATLREKYAGQTSPIAEQLPAAHKDAGAQQPPPGGNPLWGIPISALDATRERPIFSASRRYWIEANLQPLPARSASEGPDADPSLALRASQI